MKPAPLARRALFLPSTRRQPQGGGLTRLAWLGLCAAALLAGCTRTSEPVNPPAASAPAAATGAGQASVVWVDASLQPVLPRLLAGFAQRDALQIHYGDSARLRQDLGGTAGSAVQLYLGLAVPPSDNDVLVVHPGDVTPQTLGVADNTWGRTQWLWQDRLCTFSRVPVVPGTAMGQWQRQGVVLAGDLDGDAATEPLARVLVQAEGLQPGLRDTLLTKLRQWRSQAGRQAAVPAVQANLAHMAIAPCAQGRALGEVPAGLQLVAMNPALDVPLDYGLALRNGASDTARQLAHYLQSNAATTASRQLGMVPAAQP